jgi:hypothetical protein
VDSLERDRRVDHRVWRATEELGNTTVSSTDGPVTVLSTPRDRACAQFVEPISHL